MITQKPAANILCDACGGYTARMWGQKGPYSIYRCNNCGYGFVFPRPAQDVLTDFYNFEQHSKPSRKKLLYAAYMPPCYYPNLVAGFLSARGIVTGRLLDVGAGEGWATWFFQASGFDVLPLDISSTYTEYVKARTGLSVLNQDFEQWQPGSDLLGSFDVVLMFNVIEHVLSPNIWFEKARSLLKPGGELVIITPNFNSLLVKILSSKEGHICPPEHLNFFTIDSVRHFADRNQLRLLHARTDDHFNRKLSQEALKEKLRSNMLSRFAGDMVWMTLRVADFLGLGRYIICYLEK